MPHPDFKYEDFVLDKFGIKNYHKAISDHKDRLKDSGKSKICSRPEKRHKKIRTEMSSFILPCRFSLTPFSKPVSWFHISRANFVP